ncbi:Response regulator receiver domain-containing protein [Rhodoblastus acidophilus]|uniref:Response regulator receiver domain-containing protein n=1 Tax=Rhodoblastus acidophilus TaxID=1074 RepID=A0A212RPU1_RHOAC|nr:response regulator [Rhodoblastus acidophilus]PPQ38511.1 response regulator [Rhodoblastus acidophilus]RAI21824.1 response regulator [Rhodoblastus acidophilus]SNB74583.1 Response regulator receiver domain-containing protein [Rhodoblastus acidophilus]
MTLAATIAPQLPYLRRYARALAGNQGGGDAYVVAMLEALVEDPRLFDGDCDSRIATYRAFSRVWNAMTTAYDAARDLEAPHHRLDKITPLPRQAFLLTAVEGFSPDQAAQVLECAPAAFSKLVETAGREIGAQVPADALIIEDEPLIAMDLEHLVAGLGHKVVGNPRTRSEAVDMAHALRPGLVLADMHLADGSSGLDAVNDILKSFDIPVVFITAHPELLLTGQRPEPTFLIAKPFDEDMVRAVISQALFFRTGEPAPAA